MLDNLKTNLRAAIKKIVSSSGVDEELIKELSKDVQRALLQSDVNVRLVLEITKKLEERSLNETPPPGLSRKDHIIKILYDELARLLGNETEFSFKPGRMNKILLVGIQGSGKTTITIKDHDRKQIRGKAEEIEQQIGQKCADTANAVLHVTTRRRLAKARIGGIVGK